MCSKREQKNPTCKMCNALLNSSNREFWPCCDAECADENFDAEFEAASCPDCGDLNFPCRCVANPVRWYESIREELV